MNIETLKRALCAALAALMLTGAALAENPSDDVSGFNPFDPDSYVEAAPESDGAFSADDGGIIAGLPTATPLPAIMSGNNPFDTGAASASVDPVGGGDLFSFNVQPTATPLPAITSGKNPFDTGVTNPLDVSGTQPLTVTSTMMYVTDNTLKVRSKAANNAKVTMTLAFGQEVAVTAAQGEWAQIQKPNGTAGYCALSGLSEVNPNTLSRMMYAQLNTVPMYRMPTQKAGRVRNLRKGDTVTMVAITSDGMWARVSDGANYGYVPSIELDDAPSAEGTPVWCASGATAVFVNPGNWIQVSTLSFGQEVRLVGYVSNNTIAKVKSGKGYVAYCDASALSTANPAGLNTPVFVQASGKLLSTGADENAKHFNINKNARLTLLGVDNSQFWALVRQGKRKLYIPFLYLGAQSAGQNFKVVIVTQDAPLYQSNDPGAAVLGTLPMGARINLVGGDTTFAKIATVSDGFTQSVTGFVPLQYLRGE